MILDGLGIDERIKIKESIQESLFLLEGGRVDQEIEGILSGSVGSGIDVSKLQNRDRSRASYTAQMKKIADNPDYDRVSESKTPDTGAPMVFLRGVSIPSSLSGKKETIAMNNGAGGVVKIPSVYAIIEAGSLIASHTASGDKAADYGGDKGVMALNNGRSAALKKAYQQGTADNYRKALISGEHGVPVSSFEDMKEPVLVRVFNESALSSIKDPGAASNTMQGALLSTSEQAKTDANKIDSGVVRLYEGGDVNSASNRDFVRAFIGSLGGIDAVGDMVTEDGLISSQGVKRIEAAMVSKAYDNDEILKDLVESPDSDLKSLGGALKDVAGRWSSMAEMSESGSISKKMQITDELNEAVSLVIKSRREGTKISDIINQIDMFSGETNPVTESIVRLFYKGEDLSRIRSSQRIKEAMNSFIDQAMSTTDGDDMFGFSANPEDIVNQQRIEVEKNESSGFQRSIFDSVCLKSAIKMIFDKATLNQEANKTNTNPTDGQIKAGNYKKGRVSIQGLTIVIENPKGSVRSGVSDKGKAWKSKMMAHYGYFAGSEGADGDEVDVFLGRYSESKDAKVFIVNQVGKNKKFDEHKVMFGYKDIRAAKDGYLENYEKGWDGFGSIKEISIDNLKDWLKSKPKTKKIFDSASAAMVEVIENRLAAKKEILQFIESKPPNYWQTKSTDSRSRAAKITVYWKIEELAMEHLGIELNLSGEDEQKEKKSSDSNATKPENKEIAPEIEEAVMELTKIADGGYDNLGMDALGELLFEMADRIENAGLEDEHDEVLGRAAEKYGELDEKNNG